MISSSAILLLAVALVSALFFGALARDNSESTAHHEWTSGIFGAPSNLAIFVSLAVVLLPSIIYFWRKRSTESKKNAAAKASGKPGGGGGGGGGKHSLPVLDERTARLLVDFAPEAAVIKLKPAKPGGVGGGEGEGGGGMHSASKGERTAGAPDKTLMSDITSTSETPLPVTPPPQPPPEDVSKKPPKPPLNSLLAIGGPAVDALQKKSESALSSSASQVELDFASKAAAIKAFRISIRSTSK
jgi:hypothetical protein